MNTKVYYIAEVSGKFNDTSNFEIKPFTGYIYESEGYLSVTTSKTGLKQFPEPLSNLLHCNLGPWYYKVEKVRWIKVTERFEQEEEYVD